MPSIVYPITSDYRAQWGLWDALRECIYQEFLDLFKSWTITQENGRTIVEGRGAAINLRNLLLGGSDKGEGQRGRFGEGTKLGWLVLLRENVPFSLTSGEFHGLHARWTDMFGEQVMEVCWDEGLYFDGSRYQPYPLSPMIDGQPPKRLPSHDFGMVGFVKSLVDYVHESAIRRRQADPPARKSRLKSLRFFEGVCAAAKA